MRMEWVGKGKVKGRKWYGRRQHQKKRLGKVEQLGQNPKKGEGKVR